MSSDQTGLSKRFTPDGLGSLLRGHDENAEIDEVHLSLALLSRARVQRRDRERLVLVSLSIAEDRVIHPMARGGAAEAVSVWLCPTRRSLRRVCITRLIHLLGDDSADVRFWSAFSLGQIRATQARPALRRLLADRRVIDGFWAICDEAEAALANLQRSERSTTSTRSGARSEDTRTYQDS
jgi:PBS lyase HEAT-like repeat